MVNVDSTEVPVFLHFDVDLVIVYFSKFNTMIKILSMVFHQLNYALKRFLRCLISPTFRSGLFGRRLNCVDCSA